VAIAGFNSKFFSFSLTINFSSSSKLFSFIKLSNSDLILLSFLSNLFFHSSSNFAPFFPISLQDSKTFFGTENGSLDHFNFFLTKVISSFPRGDPCEEAFPDLLGEPKPIMVLHDIIVGFFDFEAFVIDLDICFSLCH
jgi:hypothetical protein